MFYWVFKNNFIARGVESIHPGDIIEIQIGNALVIETNYEKKIGFAELINKDDCVYELSWVDKIGWHCKNKHLKKDFYSEV